MQFYLFWMLFRILLLYCLMAAYRVILKSVQQFHGLTAISVPFHSDTICVTRRARQPQCINIQAKLRPWKTYIVPSHRDGLIGTQCRHRSRVYKTMVLRNCSRALLETPLSHDLWKWSFVTSLTRHAGLKKQGTSIVLSQSRYPVNAVL